MRAVQSTFYRLREEQCSPTTVPNRQHMIAITLSVSHGSQTTAKESLSPTEEMSSLTLLETAPSIFFLSHTLRASVPYSRQGPHDGVHFRMPNGAILTALCTP